MARVREETEEMSPEGTTMTRDQILANGVYERDVKPLADAKNAADRAKSLRQARWIQPKKNSFTAQQLYFDPQAGPALPEEIEAL